MQIEKINGKWTLTLGTVQITGPSRKSLESLFKSFGDPIPNCSYCDHTPCRCSKEKKK